MDKRQYNGKKKRPYESLYNHLLAVARLKKPPDLVTLTFEDFVKLTEIKTCSYCQDPVTWAEFNWHKNGAQYNLDRKDNSVGYTRDNVAVCCMPCNRTKAHRFSHDEFKVMMNALREFRRAPSI